MTVAKKININCNDEDVGHILHLCDYHFDTVRLVF